MVDDKEFTTRTEGDEFVVEIPLGSPSEDRKFAAIQFVVMLFGLFIVLPDFRLFRFGLDAGLVIRSVFAGLWVAIGLVPPLRLLFPPKPVAIRFSPGRITFDSGRAGLKYLGQNFENDLTRLFTIAIQRRKRWTMHRGEISGARTRILMSGPKIEIHSNDRTYNLGVAIPENLRFTLRDAILFWIKSEAAQSPQQASKPFSQHD